MRTIALIGLFILLFTNCFAKAPKREFRAAWIATVSNIDWPSKRGLPSAQQQAEFINRLDKLKAMGCNAVIVQIRPACDAFYASLEEPWSRYLTGKQGQPPFPYYDPLTFMVEEAHKRNMELHAWFNPFRALTDYKSNPNPPTHVTKQHPDWVVTYGTKSYLNPGIPQAREYVINIILDVVRRYDIDGVHLDDYFYPYRIAGKEFGDLAAYQRYGKDFPDKGDWRRNNVNLFVSTLNKNIKSIKGHVKFGISPFGVWRNKSQLCPEGSETRGGQTCYDDLYSDVVLWQKSGWVDYLMPQLYWEHQHRAAAFDILLPWWEKYKYNRHMYYGLGVYRMVDATSGVWAGTKELMYQMEDIRKKTSSPGIVFYSASCFDRIKAPIVDSVSEFYKTYAFPPQMKWLDSIPPLAPQIEVTKTAKGVQILWEDQNDEPIRYAVYRFSTKEQIDLSDAAKIIMLTHETGYIDTDYKPGSGYRYVVTALDRLWNESGPSNVETTDVK